MAEDLTKSPSQRFVRRFWLAAATGFVAVRALPILSCPLGRDQSTYLLIGKGLWEGQMLYRDLWDNKPPGIFYLYGLFANVFGKAMWSAAVVDILWLFAISYCIFRFAEKYLGPAGAAVAVAVHATWHDQAGYIWIAQPETFLLLLVFAAYFLIAGESRRPNLRHLGAGMLLGAAFWFKYNAVAFLPFLLLVPYLDTRRLDAHPRRLSLTLTWREWFIRACFTTGGLAAVIAAVLGIFWLAGSWPAMKEIQFEVLPRYVAMGVASKQKYWAWVVEETQIWLGFWTEMALLAGLLYAWFRRELARFTPIFFSALIGYASTAMQVRFHNYYFETCFPFFAVVWGYLAIKVYEIFRPVPEYFARRGWRLARVLVWVLVATALSWPMPDEMAKLFLKYGELRDWWRNPEPSYGAYPWQLWIEHLHDQQRVIRYLRENSSPRDGVFLWGAHELIYYFSDRRPPTRFVSNLGLLAAWTPPAWREELMRDLKKSPPRFIILARDDAIPTIMYTDLDSEQYLTVFPEMAAFLAAGYEPAADFTEFVVYRRVERSSPGETRPANERHPQKRQGRE